MTDQQVKDIHIDSLPEPQVVKLVTEQLVKYEDDERQIEYEEDIILNTKRFN